MANPIKYTARINLLKYSQDFTNGTWSKSSVTPTLSGTAPDSTSTAYLLTQSGVQGFATQLITLISGIQYRVSCYMKAGTSTLSALALYNNSTAFVGILYINWTTGVPSTNSATGCSNVTYTAVGNGWYRISYYTTTNTTSNRFYIYVDQATTTGTIYAWGAQLEVGPVVTTYIPTTSTSITISTTQSNSINVGNFAVGVNKGGYGPTNVTYFYNGKTPNVGGYTVYVSNGSGSPSPFVAGNDASLITLSNQLGASNLLYDNGVINWTIGALTINVSRTVVTDNLRYRIISTTFISPFTSGQFRMYIPLSKLVNTKTYTLSYKWKYIVGSSGFAVSDWCDNTLFNVVNTTYVDYNFTSVSGMRTVYDNVYRFMDFNIAQNTTIEIWDVQLEQKDFSTPFISNSSISTVTDALNWFNSSTTMLCTNMDYPNIVTDGLVLNLDAAYTPSYPKNGNIWRDLSGYANNGTLTNGPTYSSAGGGSIEFDGSNDYVSILNNTTVSFTIGCWINTTATSYTGTQGYEGNGIVWSDVGGIANDFVLSILNNKASWFTGDNTTTINSTTIINTGAWFYITVVKNGSNSTKELFINGISESTGTSGTSTLNTNPNISIGGNTLDGKYFNGRISQVKIYNKVLSSTEILQNYYAGLQRSIPSDGLVLSLDGSNTDKQVATASTAYDVSGNNNNGILNNGVALVSDGQRSFSFDGTNDYISIPNSSSLQLSTQIAISVWFKLLDTTPSDNTATIIQKEVYSSAVNNQGFIFRLNMSNNSIYLGLFNNGLYAANSGTNQIYRNIWYNAVGTYDGAQIKFYLNGVLKSTTNYSGGFLTNTQPLFISQPYTTYYMWGNIGQVQIYNRGLTSSEVSAIYTTTRSRYESLQGTIDGFKSRLLRDIGIFEKETCLYDILSDLKNKLILDRTSLIITPNGYKESKLYSVMPNNATSDLTVTRATRATRVNSDGFIENVPYNILTRSEEFENSYWSKTRCTVTQNVATAPDGNNTADYVIEDNTTGLRYIGVIGVPTTIGVTWTFSFFCKKVDRSVIGIQINEGGAQFPTARFNFDTQTFIQLPTNMACSFVSYPSGWYRLIFTRTPTDGTTSVFGIYPTDASGNYNGIGDGVSKTLLWGAQVVLGSQPKDYLPVSTGFNIPRIDYSDEGCPSILVEPQRTNTQLYSEAMYNWSTFTYTGGALPTNQIATGLLTPSATQNATIVTGGNSSTSGWGIYRIITHSFITGNTVTVSVFAKKGTHDIIALSHANVTGTGGNTAYFNLTLGTTPTLNAKIIDFGNGWYRCIMPPFTFTSTPGTSYNIGHYITPDTTTTFWSTNYSGKSVYLWGAQLELGTNVTSYIPTTTATVTRNEDIIESSLLNYNTTSYSIFFDIEYFENFSVGSGDISASPLIWYFRRLSSTSVNFWNQNAQQNLGSFGFSADSIKRFKGCIVFNGSTISTFVNGTKVGNQITPTNLTPYTTFLNSNTNKIRTSKVNLLGTVDTGHKIKLIYIVPTSIVDTEAINLTTI